MPYVLNEATAPTLTTALDNIKTTTTSAMEIITGSELLFTIFASTLVFIGIRVVAKVKKASKA